MSEDLKVDYCDACGMVSKGLYPVSPDGEEIWVCLQCKETLFGDTK